MAKKTTQSNKKNPPEEPRIPKKIVETSLLTSTDTVVSEESDNEEIFYPDTSAEDDAKNSNGGSGRYWEAVGRRKTSVARVRLFTRGEKGIWVNGKTHHMYFQYPTLSVIAEDALKKMKSAERFRVTAKISGGGIHAQAEALRHGIARALLVFNPDFRKRLKRAGFLTRDPRMKERKKFGLKGARKAPQWAKR